MPAHPACLSIDDLIKDCRFTSIRRSGPGGQHRNKVETAIVVMHVPTGVVAEANENRSQSFNRSVAVFRLRLELARKIRTPFKDSSSESGVELSERWKDRLVGQAIQISPEHDDFPAILAEALDVLAHYEDNITEAAGALIISSTQFVKLLKKDPLSFAALNDRRLTRGLRKLS